MKEKIKHYAKEIALFVIVMTVAANLLSYYRSTDLKQDSLVHEEFLLLHNQTYSIPEGIPVLIHFWATWCPTCKAEASNIQTLSKSFAVVSVAVKSGSDREIQEYMNKNGYSFAVVNDSQGVLAQEFQVGAYPSTFIYDKNKELFFSDVGYTSTLGLWLRMWWAK